MTTRSRAAGLLAALVLTAGLAACSDDDDPAVEDASPSASEEPADEADDAADDEADDGEDGGDAELATYCEKVAAIETVGEPDIDFESSTPEEIAEAAKAFAAERMVPLAHEIEEVAPDEIAEEIAVLVAATEELAETGDFEAAFDEGTEEASAVTHEFDLAECGWSVVDVTATDYSFDGIAAELPAGITSFEFTNDGAEVHELVVIRKNDDTTESWDELLAMPQEQAMQKTTFAAGTFATQGEEDVYAVADLQAGEYIAVCFVPVGATSEEAPADGPPHFTQGMRSEFTVS